MNGKQLSVKPKLERKPVTVKLRRSRGGHGGTSRLVVEIVVGTIVRTRIRTQLDNFRALPPYDVAPNLYERACAALLERSAPELVAVLRVVRDMSPAPALIIIRNLGVDETPVPTPLDGLFVQRDAPVELAVQVGVVAHLGLRGVAFTHENEGRLVRAVCPVGIHSDEASSQGAKADLMSHSDNGHLRIAHSNDTHPYSLPAANAYQSFATIKPVPGVPMRVRLLDDILARLDPGGGEAARLEAFTDLQRPEYRFSSPPSHGEVHRLEPLPAIVTLDDPALGFGMRFHGQTMQGVTPRAAAALDLLKFAIARTPEEVIATGRGDLVIYDNRRAVHRREPYEARFDGTDRYYLRIYGQPAADVERWSSALGGNGRVS